ncbi:SBBP repeat-containing protein [Telluribacter sp. SYSU D00476]|uniref:SBBP repeat-containing protein n=1 Tax=Telluribacter sp. SYSU D00476 TaxID=2811430 RepID=UPI001FF60F8A|nr:SBBP repeat-containing protein [Telluribacter sp. SYSU D00476]
MKSLLLLCLLGSLALTTPPLVIAQSNPEWMWANKVAGAETTPGRHIFTNAAGITYWLGSFTGTVQVGTSQFTSHGASSDILLVCYDAAGGVQWAHQVSNGTGEEKGYGITVDESGNIYLTGTFQGEATFGTTTITSNSNSVDYFVMKMNASREIQWATSGGQSSSDEIFSIGVDTEGNSYLAGRISIVDEHPKDYAYLAKYSSGGQLLWSRTFRDMTLPYHTTRNTFYDIAVDKAGNSYAVGSLVTLYTDGHHGILVAKHDKDGNLQWRKVETGRYGHGIGFGIATDNQGNCFTTGEFYGNVSFGNIGRFGDNDAFIVKYAADGTAVWVSQSGGREGEQGRGIVVDEAGNSYVTGYFQETARFGEQSLTSNGDKDMFIAQYDPQGTLVWVKQAGGSGTDIGYKPGVDKAGNVYVNGWFNGTVSFDSHSQTADAGGSTMLGRLPSPTCTNMYTVKSGDWNDATVWSCGKVPTSLNSVTISAGHTITLSTNREVHSVQLLGSLHLAEGYSLALTQE